ncbi:hypothetical protein [Micromonospora sediminicola]|uniref:hypothetical protein n=1 Tax=Micromonospora sediminicola TaxID=946078 RepID=UPI0037AC6837
MTLRVALAEPPTADGPPQLALTVHHNTAAVSQQLVLTAGQARTLAWQIRLLLDRHRQQTLRK